MPPGKRPYIRNGQIVFDSTPEERAAARSTPFPGLGMRLNGGPVGPVVQAPTHAPMSLRRQSSDDDLALQIVSSGGPPPQPPGGGSVASFTLLPTLTFLSSACGWSANQRSSLCLILVMEHEEVQNSIRILNLRRQALLALLRQRRASIPRSMPRVVFRPDPTFIVSDISGRAIIDIMQCFDLTTGLRLVESTMQTVCRYRTHPCAYNLSTCFGSHLESGRPMRLAFPAATGEVMYVINTSGQVIIAARSGKQKDLPHPTLIGEDDPEALSAGLVFFRQGRIVRIFINASGHFKPNAASSIEVSLAVFSRLPPEAFHPEFEGYRVFHHGEKEGIVWRGPVPCIGAPFAPFSICDEGETPGSLEATQALMRTGQMRDTLHLISNLESKIISGILIKYLKAGSADPVLLALMDAGMRDQYARILSATTGALDERQATRIITSHVDFRPLIEALRRRLAEFLK